VKAISGERIQIGNNRGGINGGIGANGIFGKSIRVEPLNCFYLLSIELCPLKPVFRKEL